MSYQQGNHAFFAKVSSSGNIFSSIQLYKIKEIAHWRNHSCFPFLGIDIFSGVNLEGFDSSVIVKTCVQLHRLAFDLPALR